MNKKIGCLLAAAAILLLFTATGFAQSGPPKVGGILPDLELIKSKDSVDLKYLGLSSGGSIFKVTQIKSKVLIIEIFSMYCPYCQAEAPNINRLYELIENNTVLRDKIKIIGIGAGNTQFEVGTFKRKYKIAFPLVPDDNFKLHKILGETRTPYFIVAKLNGSNPAEVIYSRQGAIENVELFLAQIVRLSGLQ